MERYVQRHVKADLQRKMVFVGGPRQVGKTTLSKAILGKRGVYLNWDIAAHRNLILTSELPPWRQIVFDEIHKYRTWRNYIKGVFDGSRADKGQILVTGSARLDLYRRGGDSLQGRYFFYRLHPLSVAELKIASQSGLEDLTRLGGFPEQFLGRGEADAKRWSLDYRTRLIRDDVQSLERLQDLGNLELLMIRLPELVGSPLSINALREDLQVSFHTASHWLDVLERLYGFFRILPFGAPKIRAVKKERKHYHFDWTLVKNPGARLENLVACHLLKWCHFHRDVNGRDLDLRFFRDIDGREVDFVVLEDSSPIHLVEVKSDDQPVHAGLKYLKQRFPKVACTQIAGAGSKDRVTPEGIRMMPLVKFLATLV